MTKDKLRRLIKDLRTHYPESLRRKHAARVNEALWQVVAGHHYEIIHCFIPLPDEIDVFPFVQRAIQENKTVIVPRTLPGRTLEHLILKHPENLVAGRFGTLYPQDAPIYSGKLDLIVVPGLAFDRRGNRLGYGAGYYDSFLSQNPEAMKVGVGFPFQVLEHIPVEPHDVVLDRIIS